MAVAAQLVMRAPTRSRLTDDRRVLVDAAESIDAAATIVDLVIGDLKRHPQAIAELVEIRESLRAIAGQARSAAGSR